MKIETIDMVPPPEPEPEPTHGLDRGIVGRAGIVLVLVCFLFVSLQWAFNVTNANARQVSSGLSSLQDRMEAPTSLSTAQQSPHFSKRKSGSNNDGPILEPIDRH